MKRSLVLLFGAIALAMYSVAPVVAQNSAPAAPASNLQTAPAAVSGSLFDESIFSIPENLTKEELLARHNNWQQIEKAFMSAYMKKKAEADTVILKRLIAMKDITAQEKMKYSMELAGALLQGYSTTNDMSLLAQLEGFIEDCLKSESAEFRMAAVNIKGAVFQSQLVQVLKCKLVNNPPAGVDLKEIISQLGPITQKMTAEEIVTNTRNIGNQMVEFLLIHPEFANVLERLNGVIREIDEQIYHQYLVELIQKMRASGKPSLLRVANAFEGPLRFAQLPGNEMKIEGLLLDGNKFDWSQYKGKVVLVDFWATWCGPCIGEIPNMQEQYNKFHDKGFEIVGYSIDESVESLKKFEEDRKLPWPVISMTMSVEKGMTNLAEYYGIRGVPTMILIGKDGKVIRTDARGETLNAELEKLFK